MSFHAENDKMTNILSINDRNLVCLQLCYNILKASDDVCLLTFVLALGFIRDNDDKYCLRIEIICKSRYVPECLLSVLIGVRKMEGHIFSALLSVITPVSIDMDALVERVSQLEQAIQSITDKVSLDAFLKREELLLGSTNAAISSINSLMIFATIAMSLLAIIVSVVIPLLQIRAEKKRLDALDAMIKSQGERIDQQKEDIKVITGYLAMLRNIGIATEQLESIGQTAADKQIEDLTQKIESRQTLDDTVERGMCFCKRRNLAAAQRDADQAKTLMRDGTNDFVKVANLYFHIAVGMDSPKAIVEALSLYGRALTNDPNSADILGLMIQAHCWNRDEENAKKYLKSPVTRSHRNNEQIKIALLRFAHLTENREEAKKLFAQLVSTEAEILRDVTVWLAQGSEVHK